MESVKYARAKEILDSPVGADFVALNAERGQCVGMEDVSAEVWRLLAAPRTSTELCDELMAVYEVDASRCRADIESLLDELIAAGLVETTSSTSPAI